MQLHTRSYHACRPRGVAPRPSGRPAVLQTCPRIHGHTISNLSASRLASSLIMRARLPHMDEELEHMQWQLDRRTHDKSAGPNSSDAASRHKAQKRRLVFHDRQAKHSQQQQHQQQRPRFRAGGSSDAANSSSSGQSSSSGNSSSSQEGLTPAHGSSTGAAAGSHSQQHLQAVAAAAAGGLQAEQQFYCLQLEHTAAGSTELHKTQERLARHIQQDGGCCVSASVSQASLLTHLLLLLQHKQLHKKSAGHWGSNALLLLQPLSCDSPPDAATNISTPAAAGLQGDGHLQAVHAATLPAGQQQARATVVHSGAGAHLLSCACPVNKLSLFASFMPLHTLLTVERGTATAAAAAAAARLAGAYNASDYLAAVPEGGSHAGSVGGSALGSAAATPSLQSWSAAESSTEEAVAAAAGTAYSRSSRRSKQSKSNSELLRAAGSSNSGASAVLLDAAERSCLHSMHVGPHADAAATAARVVGAVTAGEVLGLHVRQQEAAHAVAFSALQLASRMLQAEGGLAFGLLLVQGHSHEHVHARTHGHLHGSSHNGVGAAAAAAAAAMAAADSSQHQHHGKPADRSMDVGGFGAAFYGLGGWGDGSGGQQQQQQGVLHKHGQEVWLCVVPLAMAA